MKDFEYRDYSPQFLQKMNSRTERFLDAVAVMAVDSVVGSFGDSGVAGGRSGATRQERAGNRSKPWGPPNVDTGHLKRNIGWAKDPIRALLRRVGTSIGNKESVGYAMWLEFGTRKMMPRPFLRPLIPKLQRIANSLRFMLRV